MHVLWCIKMVSSNKYGTNLKKNSEVARKAEDISIELLRQLIPDKTFTSVHDDPKCYHNGDILCSDGTYYDAKDDGVIHRTGNVFAEELKRWPSGKTSDGWMRNGEYDYLCVLDMVSKRLYVLDFPIFKKIYKNKNKYVQTNMGDNITHGYCVPLYKCKESGCLLYAIEYDYNEDWDMYFVGDNIVI